MVVRTYHGRPVNSFELFLDSIFYLLHCDDGETTFYLKNYPEAVEDARKFFLKEYESWALKDRYSFTEFLMIQKDFHGLYWKFKKEVAVKHIACAEAIKETKYTLKDAGECVGGRLNCPKCPWRREA